MENRSPMGRERSAGVIVISNTAGVAGVGERPRSFARKIRYSRLAVSAKVS